jgi:hypothetical protein
MTFQAKLGKSDFSNLQKVFLKFTKSIYKGNKWDLNFAANKLYSN